MAPAQFPRKGEQGKARRAVYRVMKTKALLTALFVAGLVASFAVAAPAEKGKGKGGAAASSTGTTTTTSPGKGKGKGNRACKPRRAVVLRGPFTESGTDGFTMEVKAGNKAGRALKGKTVTVLVDASTKIRRGGKATLADLEAGDRLNVLGRLCSLDTAAGTLLARHVVVLGVPKDDDETTTTPTPTPTPTPTLTPTPSPTPTPTAA